MAEDDDHDNEERIEQLEDALELLLSRIHDLFGDPEDEQ